MFLFSISLLFVNKYHYFIEAQYKIALKLNFEKLKPTILYIVHLKAYANHLSGVQVMATISLQCNSFSQIHSSVYFSSMTGRGYMGEVLI